MRLNHHLVSYGDRPNDYESVSKCRSSLSGGRTSVIHFLSTDFRNKFGVIHQAYTPNRERELYSKHGFVSAAA